MVLVRSTLRHRSLSYLALVFMATFGRPGACSNAVPEPDPCGPCKIGDTKPTGRSINGWNNWSLASLQDISSCYYNSFERDEISLSNQILFISEDMIRTRNLPKYDAEVRKKAEANWIEFLTEGGCKIVYPSLNPAYPEDYNFPPRALWAVLTKFFSFRSTLPNLAVRGIQREEYRAHYRDAHAYCRTLIQRECPPQHACGLVDAPSLIEFVDNFALALNTLCTYLDQELPIKEELNKELPHREDRLQRILLEHEKVRRKEVRERLVNLTLALDTATFVRECYAVQSNFPCIHLNFGVRGTLSENWKNLKRIMAEEAKTTVRGLRSFFRDILFIHIRWASPVLWEKTADGTPIQLRQEGEPCGCSAPFLAQFLHIIEIIEAHERHPETGFHYDVSGLAPIFQMTEINFFKSALASCDFGSNLVCNNQCKCECPAGNKCSHSARTYQALFPFKMITLLLNLLYLA